MTHPDILAVERLGSVRQMKAADKIGDCLYCEQPVLSDGEATESVDGLFCSMECCLEYYEIQPADR